VDIAKVSRRRPPYALVFRGYAPVSGLASCFQPFDVLTRDDDGDTLESAERQEIALVARGDEIGLAGDGRGDDEIVVGIGRDDTRRVARRHDDGDALQVINDALWCEPGLAATPGSGLQFEPL